MIYQKITYLSNLSDHFFLETKNKTKYAFYSTCQEHTKVLRNLNNPTVIELMNFNLVMEGFDKILPHETTLATIETIEQVLGIHTDSDTYSYTKHPAPSELFYLECNIKRLPDNTQYHEAFEDHNLYVPNDIPFPKFIEVHLPSPEHTVMEFLTKSGIPTQAKLREDPKGEPYWDAIARVPHEWIPSPEEKEKLAIDVYMNHPSMNIKFITPENIIIYTRQFHNITATHFYLKRNKECTKKE